MRTHLIIAFWLIILSRGALAQYSPRYLIVHADDAGMSHSVNMATQAALESGAVSSASMMVPCGWFKEFAIYASKNSQFDYGIHLTLNSEWNVYRWGPVAPKDQVPSLVDPEGYLWSNVDSVVRNVKAEEAKIELRAQIEKAKSFGVSLSHLDTHMGALVARPDLVGVYVDLAIEYKMPILFFSKLSNELKSEYPALALRFDEATSRLSERKLPLLDTLLQFYGGNNLEQRHRLYFDEMKRIGPGVTQLIVHCGFDNEELRAITDSSPRRDQDRQIFSKPETKKWMEDEGLRIITWRQFHALSNGQRN